MFPTVLMVGFTLVVFMPVLEVGAVVATVVGAIKLIFVDMVFITGSCIGCCCCGCGCSCCTFCGDGGKSGSCEDGRTVAVVLLAIVVGCIDDEGAIATL